VAQDFLPAFPKNVFLETKLTGDPRHGQLSPRNLVRIDAYQTFHRYLLRFRRFTKSGQITGRFDRKLSNPDGKRNCQFIDTFSRTTVERFPQIESSHSCRLDLAYGSEVSSASALIHSSSDDRIGIRFERIKDLRRSRFRKDRSQSGHLSIDHIGVVNVEGRPISLGEHRKKGLAITGSSRNRRIVMSRL
jgi:hypothetical protein